MRWRLILEEFGSELKYIKDENNVVTDALSLALKLVTTKISSTSQSYMATMAKICLIALIQFIVTIFIKHRKLMLNYNKS